MKGKKNVKFLKELEYWTKKGLYANGKHKYRYIMKRLCRYKKKPIDEYYEQIQLSQNES